MIKRYISIFAAFTILLSTTACANKQNITVIDKQINGIMVNTDNNLDFPSSPNLNKKDLQKEIDTLVYTAKNYDYNTIFFEVRSNADAMYKSKIFPPNDSWITSGSYPRFSDPLQMLIDTAKNNNISVVAVVDPFLINNQSGSDVKVPFKNDEYVIKDKNRTFVNFSNKNSQKIILDGIKEIVNKYDVSGILIDGLEYQEISYSEEFYNNTRKILSQIYNIVKQENSSNIFGINMNGDSIDNPIKKDFINYLINNHIIDFIMPNMNYSTENDNNYKKKLQQWINMTHTYGVGIYTNNMVSKLISPTTDGKYFGNKNEINYQLYINSQLGTTGNVLNSYRSLMFNVYPIAKDLSSILNKKNIFPDNYIDDGKNSLTITKPSDTITSELSNYYIMGTSNPTKPLYLNNKEVTRISSNGAFGVLVDVKKGENTYKFSQDNNNQTVTIIRPERKMEYGNAPIKLIVPESSYPQFDDAVYENGKITLAAIAPSRAKVTALFNNTLYTLEQTRAIKTGSPVKYEVSIDAPNILDSTKTINLGKVNYSLTYKGLVTNQKSKGNIYVVGKNTDLVVQTNKFLGNIMTSPVQNGEFLSTVKQGCTDYVEQILPEYYRLRSGGYINKNEVNIVTNTSSPMNKIYNIVLNSTNKSDVVTIIGTADSPYHVKYNKDSKRFSITLYNVNDVPESLTHLKSKLFKNISVNIINKSTATITFTLKDSEKLWGYDIRYDNDENNNIIIDFRYPPTLSSNPTKPLQNINILIDPGHGGLDCGALGPCGSLSLTEENANLITAYSVMYKLKSFGANVTLTRTTDETMTLDDRLIRANSIMPDIFLSIHHNSVADNYDGNKASGIEAYYNNDISSKFSSYLCKYLSDDLGRYNRGYEDSYYRVTRMTYAPSVLLELGYMSNPKEYEEIGNSFNIYKSSVSIANAIMDTIANYNN